MNLPLFTTYLEIVRRVVFHRLTEATSPVVPVGSARGWRPSWPMIIATDSSGSRLSVPRGTRDAVSIAAPAARRSCEHRAIFARDRLPTWRFGARLACMSRCWGGFSGLIGFETLGPTWDQARRWPPSIERFGSKARVLDPASRATCMIRYLRRAPRRSGALESASMNSLFRSQYKSSWRPSARVRGCGQWCEAGEPSMGRAFACRGARVTGRATVHQPWPRDSANHSLWPGRGCGSIAAPSCGR
jgi:hypothetical protein